MAKAGKKRRERRQRNEQHDPCETETTTTWLSNKRSVRWRQRLQVVLMQYYRPWANLPSAALLNIFRKTDLDERIQTIPLVCKSWRTVSEHPQCWSSMIPDSISPEHAFIDLWCTAPMRKYDIKYLYNHVENKLTRRGQLIRLAVLGVSRLENLIKKSGGGEAITSLFLTPFISHQCVNYDEHGYEMITNRDIVLRLITECCPNLKHICFYNSFQKFCTNEPTDVTEEALIELISKCKRLELIDFDYIRSTQYSSSFLQKLANCLPHLRGIRIQTRELGWSFPLAHDIAKYLPRLKLLNLAHTSINSDELSSILSGCRELQYLNIEGSSISDIPCYGIDPNTEQSIRDRGLVHEACAQIPNFYYGFRNAWRCTCFTCTPSAAWNVATCNSNKYILFDREEFSEHFTSFGDYTYYLQYYRQYEETYPHQGYEDQYYSLKDDRSVKRFSQRKKSLKGSMRDQIKKNLTKEILEKKFGCQRRSKDRRRQLRLLDGRKTKFYGLQ